MPQPKEKLYRAGRSARTPSDPRFDVSSDPRFKPVPRDTTRIKLDDRFSKVITNKNTITSAKRDPYGRKINAERQSKVLERLYKLGDDDNQEEKERDDATNKTTAKRTTGDAVTNNRDEIDDDNRVKKELKRVNSRFDAARQGGFETSSSEDDDSEDSSSDEEEDEAENEGDELPASASMQRLQDEAADIELGEVTRRMAIVNLDWDHIRAADLLAAFSSFTPESGKIEKVTIYPSEFGKQRMKREAVEGPAKETFKAGSKRKRKHAGPQNGEVGPLQDVEKNSLLHEGNDKDFNEASLRAYQLDRLRYFYAVLECSDAATAKAIYDSTDGTEYLTSSNFIDLRFIPDDTVFDEEPHDICDSIPANYRPVEFVTTALQHSKVELTWDMHPEEAVRKDSIKRAFSGSKDALMENDLKAYLASESDSDPDEVPQEAVKAHTQAVEVADCEPRLSKKEIARRKMREKLGLGDEPIAKDTEKEPVGGMVVTFKPALISEVEAPEPGAETTIEKYKRKERERRERRKAEFEARKRADGAENEAAAEVESDVDVVVDNGTENGEEDLGFNDPFFETTGDEPVQSKSQLRKQQRMQKTEARQAEEEQKHAETERLRLLLPEEEDEKGFDMKAIIKAEKMKGKKRKQRKLRELALYDGGQKSGDINLDLDDRFPSEFGASTKWAIDPSQPQYLATDTTKKLTEKIRKRRKEGDHGTDGMEEPVRKKTKNRGVTGGKDVAGDYDDDDGVQVAAEAIDAGKLVAKIKNKSRNNQL